MRTPRVSFHTLGCKLNQLETESIAEAFKDAGAEIVEFGTPADIQIVNTCTVTGKAEQKARRILRQALTNSPAGIVIATGCYAQMDAAALASLGDRVVVIPGDAKQSLPKLPQYIDEHWQGHGELTDLVSEWAVLYGKADSGDLPDRFAFKPVSRVFHSRPSVKIQDGCDNRCSYCRVCLARGASVSLDPSEVLSRVSALEQGSRAEVVLTGVNLSQYRSAGMSFGELLSFLLRGTSTISFRISSFEPDRIDEAFLKAFSDPRIRPHVHLALQSGSDAVLKRMRRRYTATIVRNAVASLRSVREDPFLAADIIAGFPGESEAEFAETLELCKELDLAWIHAFPFSPRPGTPAFDMRPLVPERVAGERIRLLSNLAILGSRRYAARWAGREVDAVLEQTLDISGPSRTGLNLNPAVGILSVPSSEPDTVTLNENSSVFHPSSVAHGTSGNYLSLRIKGVPREIVPGSAIRVVLQGNGDASDDALNCAPQTSGDSRIPANWVR